MTTRPENKKLETEINLDEEMKWGVDDWIALWLQTSASTSSAAVCREEWEQPLADNEGIKPSLAEPVAANEGFFPEIDINTIPYSYGYMYILECSDGSFYTGSTKSIKRRLAQHQSGEGANHTSKFLPVKLIYYEMYDRIDAAFYREKQIQGWSRAKKIALIKKDFELLRLLSKNKM